MELAKKHDSKTRTKGANSDKRSEKSDSSSSRKTKISRFRMKMRMMSGLAMSEMMHPTKDHVTCENTYKVEPDVGRKFSPHKAEQIIQGVFDTFLSGRSYDSKRFPILSKTLAELIKERTKASGVERYKIVALVTICEDQDQSMRLASRCLWNQNYDNYASLIFQGAGFYAVGSVYAFYFEWESSLWNLNFVLSGNVKVIGWIVTELLKKTMVLSTKNNDFSFVFVFSLSQWPHKVYCK